jgi:hypothetical protein
MANGLLGNGLTVKNSFINPYNVPADIIFATATISLVNTGTTLAKVRVAICMGNVPTRSEYIEYDCELAASGGVLERTCITFSPNEKVMIYSDSDDVAVRVFGLEQVNG